MTSYASVADLRAYLPQVSDLGIQSITIAGASGGTFALSYEGTATSALAYNATATTVQTALRAIAAIGSAGVNVAGRPGGPYTATFQGGLATNAGPLSGDAALLTPASTITIVSATDAVLQDCLDRATDIVRSAMRSLLADPLFDYAAFGVPATAIVRGFDSHYLRLPAYQLGTVTLIEYQSGSNPRTWTLVTADQWEALSDGTIYRSFGWFGGAWGDDPRYRITAVWGWGATIPPSIEEVTLEVAVNIWRTRDRGGFTDTVGVDGQGSTKHIAGLTNLQKQVLCDLSNQLINQGV